MQPAVVHGKVRRLGQDRLSLPPIPISRDYLDQLRRDRFRAAQLHLEPVIAAGHVVAQQRGRPVEIDNENIDVTVIVEFSECHAPAAVRLPVMPGPASSRSSSNLPPPRLRNTTLGVL